MALKGKTCQQSHGMDCEYVGTNSWLRKNRFPSWALGHCHTERQEDHIHDIHIKKILPIFKCLLKVYTRNSPTFSHITVEKEIVPEVLIMPQSYSATKKKRSLYTYSSQVPQCTYMYTIMCVCVYKYMCITFTPYVNGIICLYCYEIYFYI